MQHILLPKLKAAANEQLLALHRLLEQLPEERYAAAQDLLSGNSIGKHMRHILELFEELLQGYSIAYVNYDNRNRSALLETSPMAAQNKIKACGQWLADIPEDKALVLGARCGIGESDEITLWSSFSRELVYNIEHAVHHMAILQIAIKANESVVLPEDFGLAYSTRKHQMEG